jgi:sec-independent protein translocase protein TatA
MVSKAQSPTKPLANVETGYSEDMPLGVSWWEILLVVLVVLLVFGPKRLPEMGRSLGKGMREFKDSVTGNDHEEERTELPPASAEQPVSSTRERDTVS